MQLTGKPDQEISVTPLTDTSKKQLKPVSKGETVCSRLQADHAALAEWNTRISEIRKKSSGAIAP
jgi:hypothetical protein